MKIVVLHQDRTGKKKLFRLLAVDTTPPFEKPYHNAITQGKHETIINVSQQWDRRVQ